MGQRIDLRSTKLRIESTHSGNGIYNAIIGVPQRAQRLYKRNILTCLSIGVWNGVCSPPLKCVNYIHELTIRKVKEDCLQSEPERENVYRVRVLSHCIPTQVIFSDYLIHSTSLGEHNWGVRFCENRHQLPENMRSAAPREDMRGIFAFHVIGGMNVDHWLPDCVKSMSKRIICRRNSPHSTWIHGTTQPRESRIHL